MNNPCNWENQKCIGWISNPAKFYRPFELIKSRPIKKTLIAARQGGFIVLYVWQIVVRKSLTNFEGCHSGRFYILIWWSFPKIETKNFNSSPCFFKLVKLGKISHAAHFLDCVRADWTQKLDFQPKCNLIPVWVHFASHVDVPLHETRIKLISQSIWLKVNTSSSAQLFSRAFWNQHHPILSQPATLFAILCQIWLQID